MIKELIKIEKDLSRPWGWFVKFIDNKRCTVKIHYIKKGEGFSLQYHKLREEFWYVIDGRVRVTTGKNKNQLRKKILEEKDFVFIPKGYIHRTEALKPLKLLEISTGIFRENDVIRLEDKYGRKSPKQ